MLTLALVTGCGSKSPKERLEESFTKSAEIKTAQQNLEMGINLNIPTEDPMQNSIMQMINGAKLKMELASDTKAMKAAGNISVDLSGAIYNIETYTTPEKMILKMPMSPKYLVIDQEESLKPENKEELMKLSKKLFKIVMDVVKEENIEDRGDKKIATPKGEVQTTEIAMSFSDKETKDLVKRFVKLMFEDKTIKGLMIKNMEKNYKMQGIEQSKEEIEANFDEMKKAFDEGFSEVEKQIKFEKLNMVYFLDEDNNIRRSEFDVQISGKDEETGQSISIGLNGLSNIWNINKEVELNIPKLTEENSTNIEDLNNMNPAAIPYQ
jgi:hypothetical protein